MKMKTKTRIIAVCSVSMKMIIIAICTRSQAVASIADRTAKNCRGHVT